MAMDSLATNDVQRLADPVTDRDHALGPAAAPVTIVEYGDYECPDCLNFVPIIAEVRRRLGERVRFVFRHFPRSNIHPHASVAAEAAEAAGDQGKFWEMHEALFRHQGVEGFRDTFLVVCRRPLFPPLLVRNQLALRIRE